MWLEIPWILIPTTMLHRDRLLLAWRPTANAFVVPPALVLGGGLLGDDLLWPMALDTLIIRPKVPSPNKMEILAKWHTNVINAI